MTKDSERGGEQNGKERESCDLNEIIGTIAHVHPGALFGVVNGDKTEVVQVVYPDKSRGFIVHTGDSQWAYASSGRFVIVDGDEREPGQSPKGDRDGAETSV